MARRRLLFAAFALAAAFVASSVGSFGRAADNDPHALDDANLRAVQFIDENEGWAVGDDGLVLHTMNKGQAWDRQATGVTDSLTALQMTSQFDGWIVGRRSQPYNANSGGVLVGTTNGGLNWLELSQRGQFPGLQRIRFVEDKKAILAGDSSDRSPSGMFFTTDGGKSWAGVRQPGRQNGWLSSATFDLNNGVYIGRGGALANLRSGTIKPIEADVRAGAALRATARSGARTWVVGDRAQIIFSDDAGVSWQRAKTPLSADLRNVVDFHAVATHGEKVWVAGRPGSVVLHSPDNGATWEVQKTGVNMPIFGMNFPTETSGYAVGAMGTLLKTEDAGKTWTPSWDQKIGRRAAVLFVVADLRDIPLSVVARYGAEEGYFCTALGVAGPDADVEPAGAWSRPMRSADAFRAAGGVYAETRELFPLARDRFDEPAEAILTSWNKRMDGTATKEIVRDIALAIRMYRPYVLVMEAPPATGAENGVRGLVARMTKQAIVAANDEKALPELAAECHLPSYLPQKIFALAESETYGDGKYPIVAHSSADLAPRRGKTYGDLAGAALPLAVDEYRDVEDAARFALLKAYVPEADGTRDLFAGVKLRPAGDARRKLPPVRELTDLEMKQLEARKNLYAIADRGDRLARPEALVAGVSAAAKNMPPSFAAQSTFRFGRRFADNGQTELAKDVFEFLVRTYPEQPLSAEALRWLTVYRASGEAYTRFGRTTNIAASQVQVQGKGKAKVDTAVKSLQMRGDQQQAWAKEAMQYATGLQAVAKDAWGDARMQLVLASTLRKLGRPDAARQYLDGIMAVDQKSPWQRVVQQERYAGYAEPTVAPPTMLLVGATRSRPKLNGVLDDDCWKGAAPVALTANGKIGGKAESDAGRTLVYLRYDKEYLYLAADCKFPAPGLNKPAIEKRVWDADVTGNDRIELFLDVDRDYASYFRLRIDQTERVAEDCLGDVSWNPKRYVAVASDENGYRVEAAISLAELGLDPEFAPKAVWAANVQRVMPGRELLSFGRPASQQPRTEGFVLLRFEQINLAPSAQ